MARQKTGKPDAESTSSPRKSQRRSGLTSRTALPTSAQKQRKTNAPAHCSRCEGNPFRSQCMHTKAGREYLLAQEASIIMTVPPLQANGLPSIYCSPQTSHVLPDQCDPPPTSPVGMPEGSPSWQPVDFSLDPSLLVPSTPTRSHPVGGANVTASGFTEVPSSVPGEHSLTPDGDPSIGREASITPSTRIRASAKRPIYNYVKHAYRGNVKHNIYRKHARPTAITTTTVASKVFLEKMNSLVEMCEDISIKTGAWLFIGAQHPAATGGAMNYCSPRLRRDGGPRTGDFATSFLKLIQKAAESKRIDTFELQQVVDEQREQNEEMQKELAAIRAEAAERSQELERFREQFGSQAMVQD